VALTNRRKFCALLALLAPGRLGAPQVAKPRVVGTPCAQVRVISFEFNGLKSFVLGPGQKAALADLPIGARVLDVYICLPGNTMIGGEGQILDIGYDTATEDSQSPFGAMTAAHGRASNMAMRGAVGTFVSGTGEAMTIKATNAGSIPIRLDGLAGYILYASC